MKHKLLFLIYKTRLKIHGTEEDVALGLVDHITFMADAEGDIANPHLNQISPYGHGTDGVSSAEAYDILFGAGGMLNLEQVPIYLDVNEDVEMSGGMVNEENGRRNPYIPANYLNVTRQASVVTEDNSGNEDNNANTNNTNNTKNFTLYSYVPGADKFPFFNGVGSLIVGGISALAGKNWWPPGHGAFGGDKSYGAYPIKRGWRDDRDFAVNIAQYSLSVPVTQERYNAAMAPFDDNLITWDYGLFNNNCVDLAIQRARLAGVNVPYFGPIATPQGLAEWIKTQKNERLLTTTVGYSWDAKKNIQGFHSFNHDSDFNYNLDISTRYDIARYKNLSFYTEGGIRDFNQFYLGAGLGVKNFGFVPNIFGDVSYSRNLNSPDSIKFRAGIDFLKIDALMYLRATASQEYYINQGNWGERNYELGVHFQL